jgi:hypothetical protein
MVPRNISEVHAMKKQTKKLMLRKETVYNLGLTAAELRVADGGSITDTTDLERKKKVPTTDDVAH